MKTFSAKPQEVERKWYVIDAADKVLGRVAVEAANILRGKNKTIFTPHVDCGDFVIIVNADKVVLTGNKENAKIYTRFSGYVGGKQVDTPRKIRARRPGGNANRQRPQGGGGRHTKGRKNFNKSESKEENSESEIEVEGTICAVLAGTMFKVRLPNGHEVLAHISGKMRKRFIKIVVGDKVRMEMSPYDMTKARITFRIG